ncbi:hypothetical protein DS2_18303, partial [Catenovulum agarivorans DS-2]
MASQYNKTDKINTDFIRINNEQVARVESNGSKADPSVPAFNGTLASKQTIGNTAVLWRAHNMPYGFEFALENAENKAGSLGYTGHVQDKSGLVYMQARIWTPT